MFFLRVGVSVPSSQQTQSPDALCHTAHDGTGSCLDRLTVCVGDTVCNKYLVPVLQACTAGLCDEGRCRQATTQFYGSMPRGVAEMLVMCECEASDQSCTQMKRVLQGGTCNEEAWTCQNSVVRCVEEASCRWADRQGCVAWQWCDEFVIKNVRSENQCYLRCYLACCLAACGHVCHSRGQRASVLVPPQ